MESLDDMILLAEIAESGSFTEASMRLGVPKSTISQRIAQLEGRLGLRLLNRSTRRVSLTNNGQVLLEYCRRVRAEADAARIAMSNLKEMPSGSIRLTCPEVTASYFMPGFLHGFARQFPHIDIDVIATNENLDIIRDRIDFAFRVGPVSSRELVVRKIAPIKRVLVASPGYLTSSDPVALPDHLLKHRCLVHNAHPIWHFSKGTVRSKISPPVSLKSDSIGFLLQSSVAGNGAAVLPAYACAPYLAKGMLVELLPLWCIPAHQMVMVSPQIKNLSKALMAFREYVKGYDFSPLSAGTEIKS